MVSQPTPVSFCLLMSSHPPIRPAVQKEGWGVGTQGKVCSSHTGSSLFWLLAYNLTRSPTSSQSSGCVPSWETLPCPPVSATRPPTPVSASEPTRGFFTASSPYKVIFRFIHLIITNNNDSLSSQGELGAIQNVLHVLNHLTHIHP